MQIVEMIYCQFCLAAVVLKGSREQTFGCVAPGTESQNAVVILSKVGVLD